MNKEERGKTLGEYQKKIKDLEERIAIMDATDSALCVDLEHWKKVAAGLKGSNKKLSERVEHYKKLDLEGDHLYEQSLVEIDNLKEKIREKDNVIKGLQSQMQEIITQNTGLKSVLKEKNDLIDELRKNIVELKTPWWKKIF